jgi:hypothetical protein
MFIARAALTRATKTQRVLGQKPCDLLRASNGRVLEQHLLFSWGMPRPRLLRSTGLALSLCLIATLGACDATGEDIVAVDAEPFESGVTKDTEGGAFRVILTSHEGLERGRNSLIARVGFHDAHDPDDPGVGIPGADLQLDAYMPESEGSISGLRGSYLGDGRYEITGLELEEAGIWRFEFSIAVGATIDESVAFVFFVPEAMPK